MDTNTDFYSSAKVGTSEAVLISRLCNRDMKAFEELYEEYRRRLSHFITNIVQKQHVVEEVFNDTMMVVWQKIDSFSGASKLSTWIFAIAYRKAIRARSKIDEPVSEEAASQANDHEDETEEHLKQRQLNKLLCDALSKLSHEHRTVVNLTYFEEMHYRDIAAIMDCPVDTIKTRMFHARRQLKKAIGGNIVDWL